MLTSRLAFIFCALFSLTFVTTSFADELENVDLKLESLGGVHFGERLDQVQNRLGKARSITNPIHDALNDCDKYVMYYDNDLEVEICSTKTRSSVHSVRVVKNDKVSSGKGVRTGMTLSQVKNIYPNSVTIQEHTIIVKDNRTHLRLRFLLSNRKVYEISLYKEKKDEKSRKRMKKKWNF